MQRELVYLLDILQSSEMIQRFISGMDRTAFEEDIKTQDAVIRRIEVIGEALRRLTPEFRSHHTGIPWQQIAAALDAHGAQPTTSITTTMTGKCAKIGASGELRRVGNGRQNDHATF